MVAFGGSDRPTADGRHSATIAIETRRDGEKERGKIAARASERRARRREMNERGEREREREREKEERERGGRGEAVFSADRGPALDVSGRRFCATRPCVHSVHTVAGYARARARARPRECTR